MSNTPSDPPDMFDDPSFGPEDDMFTRRESPGPGRGPSSSERRQRPRVVSEFVRRAIENTVGSMQSTGSLSKEALQYVLQQGDRSKKEILRIVAHEVGEFLRNVDLSSEVVKILTSVQVEVNASIRFKPTEDPTRVAPKVETSVSLAKEGNETPPDPDHVEPPAPPPEPK